MSSPYLQEPVTDKATDSGHGDTLSYGVTVMQGWRDHHEDAHNCILNFDKTCSYFAVYDGHGGWEVSQYTSMKFPKFLKSSAAWNQGSIDQALKECFVKFDELLTRKEVVEEVKALAAGSSRKRRRVEENGLSKEEDTPPTERAGTTAVVAIITDSTIYVANAGDSRCVLCRGGKAMELTRDHNPSDRRERRRIKAAGGHITAMGRVEGCLNLSRAIGDHSLKQNPDLPLSEQPVTAAPDVRIEKLQSDDEFVILACDGIWDAMDSQEAIDFVRSRLNKGIKPSTVCEEICDACLAPSMDSENGSYDNMTVIIVSLKNPKREHQSNGDAVETLV